MSIEQPKIPSKLLDEIEQAWSEKLHPQMDWTDKDIGYACGVREIMEFLRRHQRVTTLDAPVFISACNR